jgi:hypothetical protein
VQHARRPVVAHDRAEALAQGVREPRRVEPHVVEADRAARRVEGPELALQPRQRPRRDAV